MRHSFTFFVLLALSFACKNEAVKPIVPLPNPLDKLPKDTGGNHLAFPLGSNESPYGYYLYTPSAYTDTGPKFPLLIFLHGADAIGNSRDTAANLDKVLMAGPPQLIHDSKWSPKYPMVVATPQCHWGWWAYDSIRLFINLMRTKYQVDTTRVYLTGLSMGGFGTYDQITLFGKNSYLAAAVSVSGAGTVSPEMIRNAAQVPFWAFHGEKDTIVDPGFDIEINRAINNLHPTAEHKLTLFPGVGHDAWTQTYNSTGIGHEDPSYDAFEMDIYTWMLQYKRE